MVLFWIGARAQPSSKAETPLRLPHAGGFALSLSVVAVTALAPHHRHNGAPIAPDR
jgi:hypothetical protein